MAWNKQDRAFKILINKLLTDSNKQYFEEEGAPTLNIYFDSVKTDVVPASPSEAITLGFAKLYTKLVLTKDTTVPDNQCYYAAEGATRLTDWIDTQRGAAYAVTLYNNGVQIPMTDNSQWFFDYQTGVLTFNGPATHFTNLQLTGYQYTGAKGKLDGANAVYTLTYDELSGLVAGAKLKVGCQYIISDFQTVHQIPYTNLNGITDPDHIHYGVVEPLILTAISDTRFAEQVYSTTFPRDIIHYDFGDTMCEDTETLRKGAIVYRKDPDREIALSYDWRQVRFRRWFSSGDPKPKYQLPTDEDGQPAYDSYTDYETFGDLSSSHNVRIAPIPTRGRYNNIVFAGPATNISLDGECLDATFMGGCSHLKGTQVLEDVVCLSTCNAITFNELYSVYFTTSVELSNINRIWNSEFTGAFTYNTVDGVVESASIGIMSNSRFLADVYGLTAPHIDGSYIMALVNTLVFEGGFIRSYINRELRTVKIGSLQDVIVDALIQNRELEPLSTTTIVQSSAGTYFTADYSYEGNLLTEPLNLAVWSNAVGQG